MDASEPHFQVFKLAIENELRVLVGNSSDMVRIELVRGKAEIFGTEMVLGTVYGFPANSSISVHTWHGCEVNVWGKTEEAQVLDENPNMILNTVLHAVLEERRCRADSENGTGPRTLVVGPMDAGKSTLCRMLLNYASRMGRKPLFIELDVGQNSISIPGTIGVLTIEKPASITCGFDEQAAQVYQFGYKSPGHNLKLYFLMIKKLGHVLKSGLQIANKNIKSSGVIINSCGWVRGQGYNAIAHAAMVFEIDFLCVLEEERLYHELKRDMPSCVEIIYIPKLVGVVNRCRQIRSISRDARVREYFFGPTNLLRPFKFEVEYSEVKVFRADTVQIDDTAELSHVSLSDIGVLNVPLGHSLVHQVLGLSSADSVSEGVVLNHVIGFICVTYVDVTRGVMGVFAPQPSPLPKKILIMGDIKLKDWPQF